MQPIQIDEIPEELKVYVKNINSIKFPRQGHTSNVAIIENGRNIFALKRTKDSWFSSILKREIYVLSCLADSTEFPVPKVKKFLEQKQKSQCWALIEFLDGETLRMAIINEKNSEKRREMIYNFGKTLSQIHSTPCPEELKNAQNWLHEMLIKAEYNLKHNKVDGSKELLKKIKKNKPNYYKQTLIHGDYTIDNVLVSKGKVIGVIDWGGGAFGDPRYDVSLAIRPKPNIFEEKIDKHIFFEGYGEKIIDNHEYDYFVNGLYEFF